MLIALLSITVLIVCAAIGALRFNLIQRTSVEQAIDRVDAILPQIQCRKCGYAGCKPYADAIIRAGVAVNLCPPGGQATVRALAELLGSDPESVAGGDPRPQVVSVDEAACIGCTKCIQACPVDAIIGAAQQMHSVIIDDCTGCELCIPSCPVDCIEHQPVAVNKTNWQWPIPETEHAGA